MLRYEPDLGTLTFKIVSSPNLTKEQARFGVADKARNVHIAQVAFTLRSLVTSTLSFGDNQRPEGDSCTIAAAFKFAAKDGTPLTSSGKMEAELLKLLKDRYEEHGLDY